MTRFIALHRILACIVVGSLLLAGGVPPLTAAAAQTAWLYRENTGRQVKKFQWQHVSLADREVITVHEEDRIFVNHCDRRGRTHSWRFRQGETTDVEAVRRGNALMIAGTLKGQRIDSTHMLDERPWYQPLSFSLRFFLKAGVPETSFWTIRSDTLDVVTMQAEKQGLDEVEITGQLVPAFRVEIRRDGLFSSFWHGTFWFREADGLFVRYQGVHGPPGTSETVVQLQHELRRR
jgi:hypothetical protein